MISTSLNSRIADHKDIFDAFAKHEDLLTKSNPKKRKKRKADNIDIIRAYVEKFQKENNLKYKEHFTSEEREKVAALLKAERTDTMSTLDSIVAVVVSFVSVALSVVSSVVSSAELKLAEIIVLFVPSVILIFLAVYVAVHLRKSNKRAEDYDRYLCAEIAYIVSEPVTVTASKKQECR